MKTLMFYSYKGGGGRTVAAANVAAAFYKLGRRVAILDLDFEAPGLHHVFSAEYTAQFKNSKGIQHYLKGDISLSELCSEVVIDIFAEGGPLSAYNVPNTNNALLLYVMASPKVVQVDKDFKVGERMQKLLDELRYSYEIDLVVIDSASGIRDAYSIAADVSNEALFFFRWSRQHVEGTLRLVNYMKMLKEFGQSWIPYKLVACASPSEQELNGLTNKPLRESLQRVKNDTQKRIERTLAECDASPPAIFFDIPEMLELKWRETISVFGGTTSPYEELARKLLNPPV